MLFMLSPTLYLWINLSKTLGKKNNLEFNVQQ